MERQGVERFDSAPRRSSAHLVRFTASVNKWLSVTEAPPGSFQVLRSSDRKGVRLPTQPTLYRCGVISNGVDPGVEKIGRPDKSSPLRSSD